MTQKEIVTALRSCEQHKKCEGACPLIAEFGCIEKAMGYAADLIENQQRHIDELLQANDALRDTIMRRDAKIEKLAASTACASWPRPTEPVGWWCCRARWASGCSPCWTRISI